MILKLNCDLNSTQGPLFIYVDHHVNFEYNNLRDLEFIISRISKSLDFYKDPFKFVSELLWSPEPSLHYGGVEGSMMIINGNILQQYLLQQQNGRNRINWGNNVGFVTCNFSLNKYRIKVIWATLSRKSYKGSLHFP